MSIFAKASLQGIPMAIQILLPCLDLLATHTTQPMNFVADIFISLLSLRPDIAHQVSFESLTPDRHL